MFLRVYFSFRKSQLSISVAAVFIIIVCNKIKIGQYLPLKKTEKKNKILFHTSSSSSCKCCYWLVIVPIISEDSLRGFIRHPWFDIECVIKVCVLFLFLSVIFLFLF